MATNCLILFKKFFDIAYIFINFMLSVSCFKKTKHDICLAYFLYFDIVNVKLETFLAYLLIEIFFVLQPSQN